MTKISMYFEIYFFQLFCHQITQKDDKHLENYLRVLLDKPPDIETPLVWGQFFFGCIINSTYSGGLHKLKSFDLGACTVPWNAKQVLEMK